MNTIPLRARKSNDSWSGQSNEGLRPSLRRMQRSEKGARRRFIFSVSLFVFTVAGLVVGSTGGFVQEASAQENYRSGYWNQINNRLEWLWSGNSNSRNNQREESRTPAPTTQQVPAQTQQAPASTQPAPTPTQTQTQTPAPAQTRAPAQSTVAPATATTEPEVAAPVVNTAADIQTMASAQASAEAKPVTYTSNQISTESRNRLLALAVSALTSGSLIFIMSLFGSASAPLSVARYQKLGREVLTS